MDNGRVDVGALIDGRYRLDARIGHGAAGDVWRATDHQLNRRVAVKTVRMGPGDNDLALGRFRREVDAAAQLNDHHVVSLHDAGRDDRVAYLVMELLDGPSVAQVVAESGPLPLDRGLAVGESVARGLASAHRAGIIHRDIKPANVVVHGTGVKIVDFGIARLAEGNGETLTAAGFTTGTAAYLSPEQARGDKVDTASDIYSLGCLLVALFTDQPPFPRDLAVAQALAHLTDEPPRLAERRPDVPPALDALVARMLTKDPAARPTASEVADTLARIRSGEQTEVLPVAATPVAPTPTPRPRRGPAIAAAAVLVAALAFGGWQLRPRDQVIDASVGTGKVAEPATATPATPPAPADPTSPQPIPEAVWTPLPPGSSAPAIQRPAPARTTTPAGPAAPTRTVDLGPVQRRVDGAIRNVKNPGGRRQLQRAWSSLSSGMTAANAPGRLDQIVRTARDTTQLATAELDGILAAVAWARGQL